MNVEGLGFGAGREITENQKVHDMDTGMIQGLQFIGELGIT